MPQEGLKLKQLVRKPALKLAFNGHTHAGRFTGFRAADSQQAGGHQEDRCDQYGHKTNIVWIF